MRGRRHRKLALTCLMLGCLTGCTERPSRRIEVPEMNPQVVAREALVMYDADENGVLEGAELDACPGLKEGLRQIDFDDDGRLSGEEIAGRIREYQRDRLGVIGFIGHVRLDGEPLVGADVTFVPERFMGSAVKPAHATTDPGGDFRLKTEGIKLIGAQPGIYRIAITKKDESGNETIPSRYNSDTTLGVELGHGSPASNRGMELDLKSGDEQ
jgi:hypothetical protein